MWAGQSCSWRLKIHVRFRPPRKRDGPLDLPDDATVQSLLDAVEEHAHVTVAVRGGVPIPEATPLADGDEVLLLSAASGG